MQWALCSEGKIAQKRIHTVAAAAVVVVVVVVNREREKKNANFVTAGLP